MDREIDGSTCTFTCNYQVVVNIVRKVFPPFFHIQCLCVSKVTQKKHEFGYVLLDLRTSQHQDQPQVLLYPLNMYFLLYPFIRQVTGIVYYTHNILVKDQS